MILKPTNVQEKPLHEFCLKSERNTTRLNAIFTELKKNLCAFCDESFDSKMKLVKFGLFDKVSGL